MVSIPTGILDLCSLDCALDSKCEHHQDWVVSASASVKAGQRRAWRTNIASYTLYYRALDQRSTAPIVGDTWAADVLDRITADNRKGLLTAKLGRPAASRRCCGPAAGRLDPGVSCPPPRRVRAAPRLRAG